MIQSKNLQFSFPNGPSFDFPDFTCSKDEVLLILGKSGTGKTTLLHLLAGLIQAEQGEVLVGDTDLRKLNQRDLDLFRGEHVGIVFQTAHFVQSLSVIDNLVMPLYLTGKKIDTGYAQSLLDRLNIGHHAKSKTGNLSIGEKQRLSIARAIINKPQVILADEPTSALDDENAQEVIKLLQEEAQNTGAALIIVTHDNRLKSQFNHQLIL